MGTEGKRRWRKKTGRANWRLIRYADDFVVMVSGERAHAEALRQQVQAVLDPLGLRLSPEKTRVVHIDEGFDFLSFTMRRRTKRGTSQRYVYTTVSPKAVQAIKDKVRRATYRAPRQGMELDELLLKLNRMLAGWANYFRHAVAKRLFSRLTILCGTGSCVGYAASTRANTASACRRSAAGFATEDGGSPGKGSCSPAQPASKWTDTAIAVTQFRPLGLRTWQSPRMVADQWVRRVERPVP